MLLVNNGFTECEVLDMALDKFEHYTKAVKRHLARNRQVMVMDTAMSIAGAFNGSKTLEKYLASMTELESTHGADGPVIN